MRTLLAMLGILVGTASVVTLLSCGELATQAALAQFKNLGTDMLAVTIFKDTNRIEQPPVDLNNILSISKFIPGINLVAPYSLLFLPLSFQDQILNAGIIGATQTLAKAINIKIQAGRFINDLDKGQNFCVLGAEVCHELQISPKQLIGQQIKIADNFFTIVGIANTWMENSFFNQDINMAVIIPVSALLQLNRNSLPDNIVLHLQSNANISEIKTKIETFFTSNNNANQKIFFRSAKELINSMTVQHKIFNLLLGLIGCISLIVGGIGIMNIMLVSVLERKREVGIRLAVGAKRSDIQWLFLSEAVLLCTMGGLLGAIGGILITFIIAKVVNWEFHLLIFPAIIGFIVSFLVGIISGIYPANQAAKLDPIQVLRSE